MNSEPSAAKSSGLPSSPNGTGSLSTPSESTTREHRRRSVEHNRAIEACYEANLRRRALTFARQQVGDEAQDIFQIAAQQLDAKYELDANGLDPLFSTIFRRRISDCLRQLYRRKPTTSLETLPDDILIATVPPPQYQVDVAGLLDSFLALLPVETRHLLTAFYFDRVRVTALVACLGLSEGTVKMRLMRARAELKKLFIEAGFDSVAAVLNGEPRLPTVGSSVLPAHKRPRPTCVPNPRQSTDGKVSFSNKDT